MPRITFIIVQLVLVAGILLLGGSILHQQMTIDDPGQAYTKGNKVPDAAESIEQQPKPYAAYQAIAQRDLFKTPKNDTPSPAGLDIESLKPTALKLKLWGTITGEDGLTRAVIEDQTKKEQAFFRAGEEVASAKIKLILREKVVLSVRGEDQVLEIERPTGLGGPAFSPRVGPSVNRPTSTPTSAVPKTSAPRSIRIKLDRLGTISDSPENWTKDATAAPFVSDEGESGLMINRITPSSPLRRLGIRNGDIVVSINDQPVSELGDIFEALLDVSEGDALSLNFKRRGRERQIDFLFE
jgi:general secretion pathway protein C